MKVIIMRHGDAVFSGDDRVLSAQGVQEAKLTGLKLASELKITRIFASPKTRAVQTASEVRALLRGRNIPEVEILSDLGPNGSAEQVLDYIEACCGQDDTVLLVSHIPLVANLGYTFTKSEGQIPMFHTASALVCEKMDGDNFFSPLAFFTPFGESRLCKVKSGAATKSALHDTLKPSYVAAKTPAISGSVFVNDSFSSQGKGKVALTNFVGSNASGVEGEESVSA